MERDPAIGSGCWYLGQVYVNPADQRIIVRKKRGYGWTLNFARPLAVPTLLLIIAYAVSPIYLVDNFGIENPAVLVGAFIFMLTTLMAFCFWMEKKGRA